jgi:hypothetical protein
MYYFRIVNGRIVNTSLDFDQLQNECDADMEGFVISELDYYRTKSEMLADELAELVK